MKQMKAHVFNKLLIQYTYNKDWFCDCFWLVFLYTLAFCIVALKGFLQEQNDVLQIEVAHCDPAPAD